jgi:hypothetical protein
MRPDIKTVCPMFPNEGQHHRFCDIRHHHRDGSYGDIINYLWSPDN